jgi:membrane-associated phospholipid phosphatase
MVTESRPAPALAPGTPFWWRALATVGPDYTLFLVFFTALIVVGVVYGAHFIWHEGPIVLAGGISIGMILIRFLVALPSIVRGVPGAKQKFFTSARAIMRDWGPLLLIAVVFENLETYTGLIRKVPIDDTLYNIDVKVFGVEPTAWVSRLYHPLLTDWMALCYALYLPVPMILATTLSAKGRRHDFREMATAVMFQFCIGFVIFLCFPAGPPRYYPQLMKSYDPPKITSFFGIYEYQQDGWDSADPLRTRSAFPSLHCSLGVLTLIFAWRFGDAIFPKRPKLFFWICVPLVVSLWLSTIYLRHHWVPDCVAGWCLGLTCAFLSPWIRKVWPRRAEEAV